MGGAPPFPARLPRGTKYSLRDRIFYMRILVSAGAVLSFFGFLFIAYGVWYIGTPPPPPSNCYPLCEQGLWWNQIIAIGIVLVAVGLLVALIGVAVKGPSREWSEIASTPSPPEPRELPIRRCPNCGAHTYLNVCPECGYRLAALTTQ